MKTYKDIVKTKSELREYDIENNLLKSLDVDVIAHFGNCTTLSMSFTNCCLFSGYNLGVALSDVIKIIIETLGLSEEDGIKLSKIKDIPVRTIFDSQSKIIGFGNFLEDRFVLSDDVINLAIENAKEKFSRMQ